MRRWYWRFQQFCIGVAFWPARVRRAVLAARGRVFTTMGTLWHAEKHKDGLYVRPWYTMSDWEADKKWTRESMKKQVAFCARHKWRAPNDTPVHFPVGVVSPYLGWPPRE